MIKSFTDKLSNTSWAKVTPGKSITVSQSKMDHELGIPVFAERTFSVGDKAEYDSYNLSYFGPIKSITKKNVIIKDTNGKNRRLPLATFHWRNINFDLNEKQANNSEIMMSI